MSTVSGVGVFRRVVLPVVLFVVVMLGLAAGSVFAYPPGGISVSTSASRYEVGSQVVVFASGFDACAGEEVVFTVTSAAGVVTTLRATVGANGDATVSLPASTAGGFQVRAETACGFGVTSFVVSAPHPPNPGPTGGDTFKTVVWASSMLMIGVGFILVGLRRRGYDRDRDSDRVEAVER